MRSENLQDVIRRLEAIDENCVDVVIDLRRVKFHSDDEEMYLHDEATNERYMFKASPDKPMDPVRTQAQRQFCKIVGVPFPFFASNRPNVRNQMVGQWLASYAPKEGDETLVMLRIREGAPTKAIRAVLPINYAVLPLHEIVSSLAVFPEEVTIDVDEDACTGMERDCLTTHVRIIYNKELDGEYTVGVAITASEVGASDLIIDSFLYHAESKTYAVAQYGGQPFAKIQYARVQPTEVQEMLNSIPSRVHEDAVRYLDSLTDSEGSFPGLERSCMLLSKIKGAPSKLKRSILLEAQDAGDDMGTSKDFVRHAGRVAKDFDAPNRLKVERVIGSFAGLKYEKQ